MRILKFAKVDYLKTARYNYLLLGFPLLAVFILVTSMDSQALFAMAYCLFAGIILAAFPINISSETERGFLQMLPSKPGELILGHYLYGFLMILAAFLTGVLALAAAKLLHPVLQILRIGGVDVSGVYPVMLGIALVFTGLEDLLLTALRFENAHLTQLLRIVPAFIFFFGFNSASHKVMELPDFSTMTGLAALGVCLLLYAVFALAGRAISIRRGE